MRSNYDDDGFGGPMKPQMTDSVGAQPWNTPYTAPPRREWIGLTDADFEKEKFVDYNFMAGASFAAAKLKEKNGG